MSSETFPLMNSLSAIGLHSGTVVDGFLLACVEDEIRLALAAASAVRREQAGEQGWRPIETAPRDGTHILVCRAGEDIGADEIEITEWCEPFPLYEYQHVEGDLYRRVQSNTGREGFWNGNGHRATHWMPLPSKPPAAAPQSKGEAG